MQRREFLIRSAEALLVVPFGAFLVRCSSDDGGSNGTMSTNPTEPAQPAEQDPPAAPPRVQNGSVIFTSSEANAHSHTFSAPVDALVSGLAGGLSGETSVAQQHTHTVVISEDQLRQAASLQTVKVRTSDTLGHSHVFTIVKVA